MCILCAVIANIGVESIVAIATPLLIVIYPITIVLIAINLFGNENLSHYSVKGSVLGAFSVSLFDGLSSININIVVIDRFINSIPLSNYDFAWVIPAILGFIIGMIIHHSKTTKIIKKIPKTITAKI